MSNILIRNVTIVNEGKSFVGDVLIKDDRIENIGTHISANGNMKEIDASGKHLFPGIIDDHVHFREPGLTHKAEIYTESRAAAAGGVTSFMDMPNTVPNTVTQELLEEKFQLGKTKSLINYSFYLGATNTNIDEILKTDPASVCGVKVFMGASTGNMLVDNLSSLENIFSKSPVLVATHCEDETTIKNNIEQFKKKFGENVPVEFHPDIRDEESCYISSDKAVTLAKKFGTRLHLLHVSTAKELNLLGNVLPLREKRITAEVCVHHLWFDDSDYHRLGALIKWNPSIKCAHDREELFAGLLNNYIDVIGTDHAPHTAEEKAMNYFACPSGGPLVQHGLVAMLEKCREGKISVEKVVEKMCHAPAQCFRIKDRGYIREGYKADLALLDLNSPWVVKKENILSKCSWSPFEGNTFHSKVILTIVNGNIVYQDGFFGEHGRGERLKFER